MEKFDLKEGRELGQKLKYLEDLWVNNSFNISDKEIEKTFQGQMYFTSIISKFFTPAGVFTSTRSPLFLPIKPFPIGDLK